MKVDASAPTVDMSVGNQWTAQNAAAFTVTATTTSTGAPVSGVTLVGADGKPAVAGSPATAGPYTFQIDPKAWQKGGEETPVAWTVKATDEAGNIAEETGYFGGTQGQIARVELNSTGSLFSSTGSTTDSPGGTKSNIP